MKQVLSIIAMFIALNIINTKTYAAVNNFNKEKAVTAVGFQSQQNFAVDFDGATDVTWVREKNFDVADFTFEGKDTKAYYDNTGTLVGTVNPASFSDLRADAQKDIMKNYKAYTIQKVIRYTDNASNETDMVLYDNSI